MEISLRYQDPSRALSFRLQSLDRTCAHDSLSTLAPVPLFPLRMTVSPLYWITTASIDPATHRTTGRTAFPRNGLISVNLRCLVPCKVPTLSPNLTQTSPNEPKLPVSRQIGQNYAPGSRLQASLLLTCRPSRASPMGLGKRATLIPSSTWLI